MPEVEGCSGVGQSLTFSVISQDSLEHVPATSHTRYFGKSNQCTETYEMNYYIITTLHTL